MSDTNRRLSEMIVEDVKGNSEVQAAQARINDALAMLPEYQATYLRGLMSSYMNAVAEASGPAGQRVRRA